MINKRKLLASLLIPTIFISNVNAAIGDYYTAVSENAGTTGSLSYNKNGKSLLAGGGILATLTKKGGGETISPAYCISPNGLTPKDNAEYIEVDPSSVGSSSAIAEFKNAFCSTSDNEVLIPALKTVSVQNSTEASNVAASSEVLGYNPSNMNLVYNNVGNGTTTNFSNSTQSDEFSKASGTTASSSGTFSTVETVLSKTKFRVTIKYQGKDPITKDIEPFNATMSSPSIDTANQTITFTVTADPTACYGTYGVYIYLVTDLEDVPESEKIYTSGDGTDGEDGDGSDGSSSCDCNIRTFKPVNTSANYQYLIYCDKTGGGDSGSSGEGTGGEDGEGDEDESTYPQGSEDNPYTYTIEHDCEETPETDICSSINCEYYTNFDTSGSSSHICDEGGVKKEIRFDELDIDGTTVSDYDYIECCIFTEESGKKVGEEATKTILSITESEESIDKYSEDLNFCKIYCIEDYISSFPKPDSGIYTKSSSELVNINSGTFFKLSASGDGAATDTTTVKCYAEVNPGALINHINETSEVLEEYYNAYVTSDTILNSTSSTVCGGTPDIKGDKRKCSSGSSYVGTTDAAGDDACCPSGYTAYDDYYCCPNEWHHSRGGICCPSGYHLEGTNTCCSSGSGTDCSSTTSPTASGTWRTSCTASTGLCDSKIETDADGNPVTKYRNKECPSGYSWNGSTCIKYGNKQTAKSAKSSSKATTNIYAVITANFDSTTGTYFDTSGDLTGVFKAQTVYPEIEGLSYNSGKSAGNNEFIGKQTGNYYNYDDAYEVAVESAKNACKEGLSTAKAKLTEEKADEKFAKQKEDVEDEIEKSLDYYNDNCIEWDIKNLDSLIKTNANVEVGYTDNLASPTVTAASNASPSEYEDLGSKQNDILTLSIKTLKVEPNFDDAKEDLKYKETTSIKVPDPIANGQKRVYKQTYNINSLFCLSADGAQIEKIESGTEGTVCAVNGDDGIVVDGIPVSYETTQGVYNYWYDFSNIGHYFDTKYTQDTLENGRLSVEIDSYKIDLKNVCTYNVNNCTECKIKCKNPPCSFDTDECNYACQSDCVGGGCVYEVDYGIMAVYKSISLNNVIAANKKYLSTEPKNILAVVSSTKKYTYKSNWSTLKGQQAQEEITTAGETIYSTDLSESKLEYRIVLNAETLNKLKNTSYTEYDGEYTYDYAGFYRYESKLIDDISEINNPINDTYQVSTAEFMGPAYK